MHAEMNKNARFNILIEIIVKICEIAQFTRATPGSSLVHNIFVLDCEYFAETWSFFHDSLSFSNFVLSNLSFDFVN